MIRIEPTEEQWQYATDYLKQGSVGHRHSFNGDAFKQRVGITAQVIVCDYLGVPRPKNTGAFDGGVDLTWSNKTWDVKCEIRASYFKPTNFVHNLSGYQINYNVDGYIFINYNREKAIFEICGYILKDTFKRKAILKEEGHINIRDDGTPMPVQGKNGMYELRDQDLIKFPRVRR